jgi:hypothetical protein
MYHPTSISQLSASQISKALKGLPVRVSVGNQHDIELSQEQLKKFSKAGQKGKAATITLDPFQIQKHMQMLGSGKLKKSIRADAARLITSGTDRAIRSIEGSGMLKKSIRADAGRLITSGTDRAIRAIEGSGVNRLKKYSRWTGAINKTVRDGIDTAGKAVRVYRGATQPTISNMLGFGLKKRSSRKKRMSGGSALMPAGIP